MSDRKQLSFDDSRPDIAERIKNIKRNRLPVSLLLDGLQDIQNIGGLFRTADAARIKEIILYKCPVDLDKKKFHNTARSTQQYVNFLIIEEEQTLRAYAEVNRLVCLEHTSDSTLLSKTKLEKEITLVLGNEKTGTSQLLLDLSSQAVHLPMLGIQTSLNVCTAGSIAIFDLLSRSELV